MKEIIISTVLIFITQSVSAYPISPQTLRKLIDRSHLIVIATIENPTMIEKNYNENNKISDRKSALYGDRRAGLKIKEILKGESKKLKYIEVEYNESLICPKPPQYPDKKTVLAFLTKSDDSRFYRTVGLSYGSKIMNCEDELSAYRSRIQEYIDILKIRNTQKRYNATVEWLFSCAENKYTRWEGVFEFIGECTFMFKIDHSVDLQYLENLSDSDLNRLNSLIFTIDTLKHEDLCLVNLVPKEQYPYLRKYLTQELRKVKADIALEIMDKILDLSPNEELQKILNITGKLLFDDPNNEKVIKELIEKFILIAE